MIYCISDTLNKSKDRNATQMIWLLLCKSIIGGINIFTNKMQLLK